MEVMSWSLTTFSKLLKSYRNDGWLVGLEFNGLVNTVEIMLSWSVYLTTFPGQALSFKQLSRICAPSFARTWQLPSWISGREKKIVENISDNLYERMLPDLARIKPATSWSPVWHASNWATEAHANERACIMKCSSLIQTWDPTIQTGGVLTPWPPRHPGTR